MTGVSEWSETWVQVDTSYAHFWSPSNERSESRCCKETDQNKKGKKSKHFRRENQLLGSDTCLVLFPGNVGMQSRNETKWQHEQHSTKLIVSAYQHDKMLLHFPFIETEKKRKKKRREKKIAHPSSRIRTSDLWMTLPLQSTALPTELSKDNWGGSINFLICSCYCCKVIQDHWRCGHCNHFKCLIG